MAGQILIYDGISANRIVLRCKLSAACYDVGQAESLEGLRAKVAEKRPEVVILDGDEDIAASLRFCRDLKSQHADCRIPVLLLVTNSTAALRIAALNAGAWEVLPKPIHDDLLMATLRRFQRQRMSPAGLQNDGRHVSEGLEEESAGFFSQAHVALVSANAQTSGSWLSSLSTICSHRLSVLTTAQALSVEATAKVPDIFVVKAAVGRCREGLRLLSELRCRIQSNGSRTILILDAESKNSAATAATCEDAAMALDLGADEVMLNGFQPEELLCKIDRQISQKRHGDDLRRSLKAEMRLATLDPLTGLYNRRYAFPRLDRMLANSHENRSPMAFMMVDLDRFKSINDTYGHAVGDAVLANVARDLTDVLRPQDLIARYGGEEFLVALPDTDQKTANQTAQMMRERIRSSPVTVPGLNAVVRVTLSIGVSGTHPGSGRPLTTMAELIDEADRALRMAKTGGRDKVTFARPAA